jgi:hypothetical protein
VFDASEDSESNTTLEKAAVKTNHLKANELEIKNSNTNIGTRISENHGLYHDGDANIKHLDSDDIDTKNLTARDSESATHTLGLVENESMTPGQLVIKDKKGNSFLDINGGEEQMLMHDQFNNDTIKLNSSKSKITLGGGTILNTDDPSNSDLPDNLGSNSSINIGTSDFPDDQISLGTAGKLDIRDQKNNAIIQMQADEDKNIRANGTIEAKKFEETSDARCKENLEPINQALEKISQLHGVSFNWRKDASGNNEDTQDRHIGFIAQKIKEILPEVVSQDQSGYYTISYSEIVPVLAEAIKEQQDTIEKLQRDYEVLEKSMENRIAHLEKMFKERPA